MKREIYVGADHAGFELKEAVKEQLLCRGYVVHDIGARNFEKEDDYPGFAQKLGEEVVKENTLGILFCGSGTGMCIAANKVGGVRAVAANSLNIATASRKENNTNVLCLSGRFLKGKESVRIALAWLNTPFSKEKRYARRIKQISQMEENWSS